MSYTRRVAYNTIVQIIGKILTTIISLFLVAALTRYLGVSGYGQYTTIFALTQFFAVFADFGFFWFLVREISKPDAPEAKIFNNVLTFRSFLAAAVFALSIFVGLIVPQYHAIRFGIAVIAAASFWLTLNSTYVGIFQNRLRMDKAALTEVLGRLVTFGAVLYFIRSGATLNLILWAYFFGNFFNFLASALLGQKYLQFRFAFDFGYWREIFRECLPIFIVSILGLIYFKVDTIMLSLLKTSTDVGIYGPPYKVIEILILYPAIFMGSAFPILTRYHHAQDERLEGSFQKAFDFLIISAVPVVIGIGFIARRIIAIVAGPAFTTAHTIAPVWGLAATSALALQILVFAVGISFLSHLFGYMVIAIGKQTKLIWPNLFLVFFNIILNLILIPRISYIGAAIVTVLTEICVVLLYFRVMRAYIKLRIRWVILPKVLFSGIVLGLALYGLRFLSLWYLVPVGIVVYFASLYLVKGVSKEMVLSIIKRDHKLF